MRRKLVKVLQTTIRILAFIEWHWSHWQVLSREATWSGSCFNRITLATVENRLSKEGGTESFVVRRLLSDPAERGWRLRPGEKCLDYGCILKLKSIGFAHGLDKGCEKKASEWLTTRFFGLSNLEEGVTINWDGEDRGESRFGRENQSSVLDLLTLIFPLNIQVETLKQAIWIYKSGIQEIGLGLRYK